MERMPVQCGHCYAMVMCTVQAEQMGECDGCEALHVAAALLGACKRCGQEVNSVIQFSLHPEPEAVCE